ncbi:MAG TPA: hypothetical protein VFV54_04770 [Thermoanaerobaculia bacterium]|nr:hypothetical protein [Thermoanaerobaculia bacterium]
MKSKMLVAALLVTALAGGCRQAEEAEPSTPAAPASASKAAAGAESAPSVTTTDAVVDSDVAKLAIEEPIEVSITDSAIAVKGSPIPGATRFQVTNNGTKPHTLTIEGSGVKAALDAPLAPLEVRSLTADLQPGTYRLYCPMEPDALTTQLEVAAPAQ